MKLLSLFPLKHNILHIAWTQCLLMIQSDYKSLFVLLKLNSTEQWSTLNETVGFHDNRRSFDKSYWECIERVYSLYSCVMFVYCRGGEGRGVIPQALHFALFSIPVAFQREDWDCHSRKRRLHNVRKIYVSLIIGLLVFIWLNVLRRKCKLYKLAGILIILGEYISFSSAIFLTVIDLISILRHFLSAAWMESCSELDPSEKFTCETHQVQIEYWKDLICIRQQLEFAVILLRQRVWFHCSLYCSLLLWLFIVSV